QACVGRLEERRQLAGQLRHLAEPGELTDVQVVDRGPQLVHQTGQQIDQIVDLRTQRRDRLDGRLDRRDVVVQERLEVRQLIFEFFEQCLVAPAGHAPVSYGAL